MDPTWNWANYGQIHAQANYYAAARQLRGAQNATNSGQSAINASSAQNHHANQNQMSSYQQNQMTSWFALHGPHTHPGFNPAVHQSNNHADATAFATNPFGIHGQSATHASYDSGFLTGFQTAAATAAAAAKANYLQPNHTNFKQLTAKEYDLNLRAAGFPHPHCGAMQTATPAASMTHTDTSGMSAATGAHLFPHLTPSSWRHHQNLMATHNHGVSRSGPFGPMPHEETNLMQTRAAHHSSAGSMSAHSNSSGHSNKSCSMENSKQLQHQKHSSSSSFFNQTMHSTGSRNTASSFDHFSTPKLAHHNQPQADHHYLAMQAAVVGMTAAPNQHMLTNSRASAQCQYPSMNFPGADILMAVGSTPSMTKHNSNNQCHVRGTSVTANNNYCGLMMGSVPNINNYTQNHHASVAMSGSMTNHGNSSRSSSAASNHAIQGSESSSGSYGYNSPSTNHPHSPYQQRNTASVASVSGSSQASTTPAVAANVSNGVQDFTGTTYLNQGNAYAMNNSANTSTRIDYPTPPSSAQIVPQTQPGSTQGQDDSLGHYPTSQNSGNGYPSNSFSPYQTGNKLSSNSGGPGSNNSVVSNAGSSSCMVEAAARAAAASNNNNNNNSNAGYHHNPLSAHNTSLSESDADACLSNIVNVTPISDGMSDISKLNDSQMNSTLNDVLSGQGIDFQSINYSSGVDQTVNFTSAMRIDGHTTASASKKKNKVKKHKKKDKTKCNERISMNTNNTLPFNLPLHYNYNESYTNQSCTPYSTAIHPSQPPEQQIHPQSNMMPITNVAESSQCFDPSALNMQTNLIDESLTAHLSSQQHSQSQASQQQQQTTQRNTIEFDKSQHNTTPTLVNHHQTEQSNAVLQQTTDSIVNEKDLMSDLEDDLSFLTEAAECPPPTSNDIGTQAGNQLVSEAITHPVIETSSVATSTECTTTPVESCTTSVPSPIVTSVNSNNNNVIPNGTHTHSTSRQHSGYQQSFKFVPNSENSQDVVYQVSQPIIPKNEITSTVNSIPKKKKSKEVKETKRKSSETINGVKPAKNTKSNKCEVVEDKYEKQAKSLLNNNKIGDNVKSGDSLKRTSEQSRDHEAKFFKVRPTLNTAVCLTSQPTTLNTNLPVITKEKSRKRRSDEFSSKNTHDEYEFPDSPNPSANKKSKKILSNETTSVKKKVCEKLTVPTTSTKKANNSNKSKLTVNSTQTSTVKQQNNANCENVKNELKHPPINNISVNVNASINCNKTEVKKTEKHRHHDNNSVQKQEQIPPIKQKTSQTTVHQQTQLPQPNPQPQPIPPTPQLQQSLQSQLPTHPQFPAKIQNPLQQSKKNATHENKNKKESSNTLLSNTPSHLLTKTSQSISVQSAGTNTPRRRSQDKKALTIREGLMRTGDFVVSLDEVTCELPMIWRIEGKSLLQRFEPSEQDSIIVYTNTSSYSAWNPTVRQRYTGVDVRIMGCSRTKVVVEKLGLTKTNPNNVNGETVPVERNKTSAVGSTDQQQENFEVFIQTLVSQALDPNFIAEIVKENDDYFLSHVQAIDEFCSRKKSRFFSKVKWDANVVKCVETFPTFTVIPQNNVGDLRCRLCHDNWSTQILHFSGDPYDQMTLESKDPLDIKQTKYAACDVCKDRITLFSRLHHQKYSFYLKCREKVEEMRAGDENKESHIILEQCLQDTVWIQSLFKQLEKIWVDCDDMR